MGERNRQSVLQVSVGIWLFMHCYFLSSIYRALHDQKARLSKFGELDAKLLEALQEAGYTLDGNVMKGDLRFDEDGVDITECAVAEGDKYGNKSGWSSRCVSAMDAT